MPDPASCDSTETGAITDSPWFWLLLFSLMATVALVAISGKYGRRQAGIERKFQARERLAHTAASEEQTVSSTESADGFSQPGQTLIPLWPLAIVLAIVALVSGVMLVRSRAAARDLS